VSGGGEFKLTRAQMLSLLLEDGYWFAAGYLVAVHGWEGGLYAMALRVPLSFVRAVMREIHKMKAVKQ